MTARRARRCGGSPGLYRRSRNFAVGIFRGKKSAALRRHIAPDIIERVARDRFEDWLASDLKCFEIGNRQLSLVVEHFFEVRHVPVSIDRIPVEPAAKM